MGVVTFAGLIAAPDDDHPAAGALDQPRVVGPRASSRAGASSARASASRRNTCGVCTAHSSLRSSVSRTASWRWTHLTVSVLDTMKQALFGSLGVRYQEYVTHIQSSGLHLLDLISDILDTAKLEAGKMIRNMEPVYVAASAVECVRVMERVAENAGVALTANVPAEGVSLLADRRAIKQILLNLLSNALKFTPAGGTVGVAVAAIQDRVQICVRDNGVGIPNDKLAGLGRPFEQVSDNAAHARQGTGLGLALIHGLVAKHGGMLRIDSALGEGTVVTIDFPVVQEAREVA